MDAAPAESPAAATEVSEGAAPSFSAARLRDAALDSITGLACIAVWSATWTLLDEFQIHALPMGCFSVTMLLLLCLAHTDVNLDWLLKSNGFCRSSSLYSLAAYGWTLLLALLSLSIWRMGVFLSEVVLLPRDETTRACTLLSMCITCLIMSGRFSSIAAAPVIIAEDDADASSGFMKPNTSGPQLSEVLGDFMSAVPAVLAWDSFWLLLDNSALPCWPSAAVSGFALFCLCAGDVQSDVRSAQKAASPLTARLLGLLWMGILGSLCMWLWRGFWEMLPFTVSAVRIYPVHESWLKISDSSLLLLVGLLVLLAARRTRSLMFPPVVTTFDQAKDPFIAVGQLRPSKSLAALLGSGYGTPTKDALAGYGTPPKEVPS